MRWVDSQSNRVVELLANGLECQTYLLVDVVIAVALAVCSVEDIVFLAAFFSCVRVLQGFLFVLPDAVSGLDEIVVPDGFDPREVDAIVEAIVIVAELLVDKVVVFSGGEQTIFRVRVVQPFVIRITESSRERTT